MSVDFSNMLPVLPEALLLGATLLILLIDLFLRDSYRMATYVMSIGALLATLWAVSFVSDGARHLVLQGAYVQDSMGDVLKAGLLAVAVLVFIYSKDYLRDRSLFKGEFYILALLAILGMMVMISAAGFLSLYLGLELLALCMYALVSFNGDSKSGSEAAMKYFVLGAMASGLLLYGISMIYGATGALDFAGVSKAIASGHADRLVLVFGLVFVLVGIAFKFGAVPFHMWAPDVYEGAPISVVTLLGSIPKIAAFAMAFRILAEGLGGLHADWQGMLVILAVLSMALGNLVAIAQHNIRRMLAYSTISHVGFIFLGLIAGTDKGYSAAMYYAVVYALTAAGGLGMLVLMSRHGFEAQNLHDLKGLNQRSPWLAGMMMLIMFSMAGVPPTVGFFAKLFVLDAVVQVGMTWLALVAVFFSIIGAFYYIRVVKVLYFDKPIHQWEIQASWDARVAISINGLAMLLLGMFPATLMTLCQAAFAG